MTRNLDSSKEAEIRGKIENYKNKRRRIIATFLIGMFGIYVLPFGNLILVLAIIVFGIAPLMFIYYTWKKRQMEKELKEFEFNDKGEDSFDSLVKK